MNGYEPQYWYGFLYGQRACVLATGESSNSALSARQNETR